MATVDLSQITSLTLQIQTLQQQASLTADPTVKAFLSSQIAALTAQLQAVATHQQAQIDAQQNLADQFAIWGTLTNTVGSLAPSIIGIFTKR